MRKLIILFLFILPVIVFATEGDLEVAVIMGDNVVYSELSIDVFNLDQPQSQPIIFMASVTNNTDEPITDYQIEISMSWRGNMILDYGDIIVSPKLGSSWHTFNPGETKTLSNRDIIVNNSVDFSSQTNIDLDEIRQANPEFEDILLQTGRIPDGTYSWNVQFKTSTGENLSNSITISYSIVLPINIILTSPGSPIGVDTYFSPSDRPTFLWFSNLDEYSLSLYPVESRITSPEDLLGVNPVFTIDNISGNIQTFPESEASLIDGLTYAWQVSAETFVPNGLSSETKQSQFYLFKVNTDAGEEANNQALLNFFNQLSGEDVGAIIDLMNSGYSLKGLNLADAEISIEDLINLLNQYQSGSIQINSITVVEGD